MPGVNNSNLLIDFDLTRGITLSRIFDVVARRNYLPTPSMFFEFAVNNGPAFQSDTGLRASLHSEAADGSAVSILADTEDRSIGFGLTATLAPGSAVAVFELEAVNLTPEQIFLRVVMPKIFGVRTPGHPAHMMGAIPQEGGWVAPLRPPITSDRWSWSPPNPLGTPAVPLGMKFMIDVGLPNARNHMEVASIFDRSTGGGVFFCDMDGDLDNGIAPLQFNLSAEAVVGFWIGNIEGNKKVRLPRLAIGVHSDGDWHKAVDYYTLVHRPRWSFPSIPTWFREAGAIYTPAGGGAGGIYLSETPSTLADGAVWTGWDTGNHAWNNGLGPLDPSPGAVQISPGGFIPTGSLLQAIKQSSQQVTVFGAGFDGAIRVTWESNDGPWQSSNGPVPARITPQNWVEPGIPLACAQQGDTQWDVFFTRPDGSVWVTWKVGDGWWTDGQDSRPFPAQIVPPGTFRGGTHLAAAQLGNLLNLFGIGNDGAIWVWSVAGLGEWSSGTPLTTKYTFPKGAPLVAAKQNDSQLNVFAVDRWGTVRTAWLTSDSPDVQLPVHASPPLVTAPGGFLAAAKQSGTQLDVFYVGNDGAVWVTWQQEDGWRTDGNLGRVPLRITPPQLANVGAPVAVTTQGDELQVFVAGTDSAISVTWEKGDSAWTDGYGGRPGPQKVKVFSVRPSSGVAAVTRNDTQVDVFSTIPGRIKSFLELPNLLMEANALGTNVLYLMDYWEGVDKGGLQPYSNKGDYVPRSDLGGEDAFIEGINLVHQAGGRVLLYVESFIIYQYSSIGLQSGNSWGGRDENGKRWGIERRGDYPDYAGYFEMVACFEPWQEQLVQIAQRLVGEYGADGIMLDSCAWQMNRPMRVDVTPTPICYSAQDFSNGVLMMVQRVRTAIQEIKPDAVVIGETTAGPIARHWDGGLSADLGFGNIWIPPASPPPPPPFTQALTGSPVPQRLIGSPVRYGIPEVHMFGNGLNLGGLHQIFAAGHGLALCSNFLGGGFMSENAAHIQKLVHIRVAFRDALIYGAQINQPSTDNPMVVAYQYQGSTHRILTVVNLDDSDTKANISLDIPDPGGRWINLLGNSLNTAYHTDGSGLFENVALTTGPGSLLVLLNIHRSLSKLARSFVP